MKINDDIKIILEELSCLNGQKLNAAYRAATMGTFGFGETRKEERNRRDKDGNNITKIIDVSKYALHIQIPFRFVRNNKIIHASWDMFEPTAEVRESADFDWKDYNNSGYDIVGNNRYDENGSKIFAEEDFIVSNVEVTNLYDLKIFFTNGCVLETFVNATTFIDVTDPSELWRFFETGNLEKEHLVILLNGIEVYDDEEEEE